MKKKPQFYFHIHHHILLELLTEPIENRINYIKKNKPKDEIKLRLKLLKPVKGKLSVGLIKAYQKREEAVLRLARDNISEEKAYQRWEKVHQKREEVHQKLVEARQKYVEARQKWEEAYQKYKEAHRSQRWVKANQKWEKAYQRWVEARQKYVEARQKWEEAHRKCQKYLPEIIALHSKECPNCPWNGTTIFPQK